MTRCHVVTFHKYGSNWFRRLFREAATLNGANIAVRKNLQGRNHHPVATDHATRPA